MHGRDVVLHELPGDYAEVGASLRFSLTPSLSSTPPSIFGDPVGCDLISRIRPHIDTVPERPGGVPCTLAAGACLQHEPRIPDCLGI